MPFRLVLAMLTTLAIYTNAASVNAQGWLTTPYGPRPYQVPDPVSRGDVSLCQLPIARSPGIISWLNSVAGRKNGPAARVIAVENTSSAGSAGTNGNGMSCHATLVYADGRREAGIMTLLDDNPAPGAPLRVTWESDSERNRQLQAAARSLANDPVQKALSRCIRYLIELYPGNNQIARDAGMICNRQVSAWISATQR